MATKKLELKFESIGEIRNFIHENESSLYGGVNAEGEDVMVNVEKGKGMEVRTFQDNGWLRVNYYNENGYDDGESFEGRWR